MGFMQVENIAVYVCCVTDHNRPFPSSLEPVFQMLKCRYDIYSEKKDPSSRWNLNPRPSVIWLEALTTELLEIMVSKHEL